VELMQRLLAAEAKEENLQVLISN
jgi:hypothetical protein